MSEQVLIDRSTIHTTRPVAKALLAILCWGNSAVTMTLTCLEFQMLIWKRQDWLGALAGLLLALAFSIGQVFTSDASRGGYWFCLAPDLATTAWQWRKVFQTITRVLIPMQLIADMVAWGLALFIGYHSARLPERLVFGPRRKKRHERSVQPE